MIQTYDEVQAAAVTICVLFVSCLGLLVARISLAVPHSSREWRICQRTRDGGPQGLWMLPKSPSASAMLDTRGLLFKTPCALPTMQ